MERSKDPMVVTAGKILDLSLVTFTTCFIVYVLFTVIHGHVLQYTFNYDVQDPPTGDVKDQVGSRTGNVVSGQYPLVEFDGTRRIVHYTDDGFNAMCQFRYWVASTFF
ncbi:Chitin bind 4 domain containing protein [Asbolus verrucosus]|uniref:Chitin bind 4 domain containing protein n=1 Tax=Asbolus verrucosus TaxID=1661398 RepID=A0A482VT58_ASBVE|nr:Chitin bind 4 domain containing protein [Asbolus verrucosus]